MLLNILEIIQGVPTFVQVVLGMIGSVLGTLQVIRKSRKNKIDSKMELLKEYKQLWIKSQVEVIELSQSDSNKRRVLMEMKNKCNECYKEAIERTGIKIEELGE